MVPKAPATASAESDKTVSSPIKHDPAWNISRVAHVWYTKSGTRCILCNMADTHLIYTIVKIERDGMPQKIGANDALQMYKHLVREIDYRGLMDKLNDWRIFDAKTRGDVRRVVKAVKIKEEHDALHKRP